MQSSVFFGGGSHFSLRIKKLRQCVCMCCCSVLLHPSLSVENRDEKKCLKGTFLCSEGETRDFINNNTRHTHNR